MTDSALKAIAEGLYRQGYLVQDGLFSEAYLHQLLGHFQSLDDAAFSRAGIGRDEAFQVNQRVRADRICWLDPEQGPMKEYADWIEQLRLCLNEQLFLGLFDYECHYAYYPAGGFYRTHLDAFADNNVRKVSTILYLNPDWQPGHGGELVIYAPPLESPTPLSTVAPVFGRLVIFLSEDFPHEVLPVTNARYSLTGWFRVRDEGPPR